MDRSRDVDDRRRRTKRKRLRLVVAGTSQEHADQPGEVPDRLSESVEAPIVEHRNAERARRGGCLVRLRRHDQRRQVDAGGAQLVPNRIEPRGARRFVAENDPVRAAQDAEQRAPAAPVLGGPFDQTRDLDELEEHAANPCERWDGPRRRERVVAGFDLDVRERLEQRRLARVGPRSSHGARLANVLSSPRAATAPTYGDPRTARSCSSGAR